MKLILLINVKIPTVGILTFIRMIITIFESVKVGKVFIFHGFSVYVQLKSCSVELSINNFKTSRPVHLYSRPGLIFFF